jgi:hypothetical protein
MSLKYLHSRSLRAPAIKAITSNANYQAKRGRDAPYGWRLVEYSAERLREELSGQKVKAAEKD